MRATMPQPALVEPASKRILSPVERVSEILFGLIMALTFTGTLSAATAGREEVRTMLIGAIGCNLAWGLVDAVMYLVAIITEQGRKRQIFIAVRADADHARARALIADALPPIVAQISSEQDLETVRTRLAALAEPLDRLGLGADAWRGAVAVFLLVCLSTFPVVVPFMFMQDALLALRISNGIAIVMMFMCGFKLGSYAGRNAWLMGLAMAFLGALLVAITIALGG
jgi:VIT1/CCC1 family predicted Fe2+/Mn2+ transporter